MKGSHRPFVVLNANSTSACFSKLEHVLFWRFAHWLGRKYKIQMPEVMRRFKRSAYLGRKGRMLFRPTSIKTERYRKPCRKPNPYTMQEVRPGMADLKLRALARDGYTC